MTDLTREQIEALLDGTTPGPWLREAQGIYADNGHKLIASVKSHDQGIAWPTTEANGNIMALAPDLARALLDARAELAARQEDHPMTHDTPPKRIWAWYLHPEMRNDVMEGGWTESPDKREAEYILTSDAAAMVAAVLRVKPLQWKEYPNQGNWRADTPVGEYSVGFDDGWWAQLEGVEFWNWETPEDPRSYSGPEAGMNACKADYETRILATLEKIE